MVNKKKKEYRVMREVDGSEWTTAYFLFEDVVGGDTGAIFSPIFLSAIHNQRRDTANGIKYKNQNTRGIARIWEAVMWTKQNIRNNTSDRILFQKRWQMQEFQRWTDIIKQISTGRTLAYEIIGCKIKEKDKFTYIKNSSTKSTRTQF